MEKHTDNHGDAEHGRHTYRSSARPGGAGRASSTQNGPPHGSGTAPQSSAPAHGAAPPPQRPTPPRKGFGGFVDKIKAFFGRLTKKQLRLNIIIASIIVVLILAIILAMVVPGCTQRQGASSSLSAPSSSASVPAIDPDYDKDANALPVSEYAGVILPKTDPLDEEELAEYLAETLFLGDSNTERMYAFRDATGLTRQNAIGVEGMHIAEFTTKQCVKFSGHSTVYTMPQAVEMLQPLRVVITFGTNDAGWTETEKFRELYADAIEAIQEAYPYADIIIGSVFPIEHNRSYSTISMTQIDKFNLALAALAKEMDCYFLNWSEPLKDASTGYCKKGQMLDDGLHLNAAGMKSIFDYVGTHILNSEDTRPKPLKDRPTVAGAVQPDRTPSSSSSSASQTVSVSFAAGTGGKISIGGATQSGFSYTLKRGDATPAATAVPDTGYVFKQWTASGVTLASPTSATLGAFTIPESAGASITVSAMFEKAGAASVTFSAGAGGTISPSGTISLAPGAASGVYTATPQTGYTFGGWNCSAGSMAASGGGWVFTVPAGHDPATAITVVANFAAVVTTETITFNVAVVDTGGTSNFTVSGSTQYTITRTIGVDTPATINITVTPTAGGTIGGQASATYTSITLPASVASGGTVTLSVTITPAAPTPVLESVPDFSGRTFAASLDGWTLSPTYVDDTAAAGTIIAQGIAAGTQVERAVTAIPVTVSNGPTP